MNTAWPIELVAGWCDSEAGRVNKKAEFIRRRFKAGPLTELADEYALILEKHAIALSKKREELMKRARLHDEFNKA